jgi:DNA replication protein DnaC
MTPAQLERLGEQLQRLRLFKSKERLEALLQEAASQELPYADFLERVLSEEVASKTAKHVSMRTSLARFPFVKSLETFDFAYQPSLDKKQIQTLASCHFIEHGENIVILGPPGVGKKPSRRWAWSQSDRARLSGVVYHRRRHDHHAHQSAR